MTVHTLPIKLRKHAAMRAIERFDLSIDEIRHIMKTGKQIKEPKKDQVGIIERKIGNKEIRIIYTIKQETIWVITIEGDDEE